MRSGLPVEPLSPLKTMPSPGDYRIENNLKPPTKKPTVKKHVSIKRHESFEDVILRLEKLPAFMNETGEHTFYISDVENENDREFAYAYWKEKSAIIVLQLPLYGKPTDADLYWLSGKAYIDLKEDVVPKLQGNMGCCLVTKAWADKILKRCQAGYKLKVVTKTN